VTYDLQEISDQSGFPVELYEFTVNGVIRYFTSGQQDYEYQTKMYLATPLSRSEFEETGDLPKNDITLTCRSDFVIARLFRAAPPSDVVLFTLREVHFNDGAQEAIIKWRGRVLNVSVDGPTAQLNCENVLTSMRRTGLRRLYQRQCPHILYGGECKANSSAFLVIVTLSSVDGITLNSGDFDALPDNWFAGGYIEWEVTPGVIERRAIKTHIGANVTITHPVPGLVSGQVVNAFPGCDHTVPTCIAKFNNVINYGGFPYIPGTNPYGGNSVF